MESVAKACSAAGVAGLTLLSWVAVAWVLWPFVAEAVTALHRTYGY